MAVLEVPGNIIALFDNMNNASRRYYLQMMDRRDDLGEIGLRYATEIRFPNNKKFGSHAGKAIAMVEPNSYFAQMLYEWRRLKEDSVALKLKLIAK